MKQTIYIDVLVCLNLFINYFILIAVARFMNLHINKIKIIVSSLLGAIYSLYILLPQINFVLSIFIKIIMSLTIVITAYKMASLKMILKTFACFYLMNFLFCGVIFAIWYFVSPKGILVNNGVVYFNISPLVFLVMTVLSYIIIKSINVFVRRPQSEKLFYYVEIEIDNKKTIVVAKVDTGNSLKEPFSHLPVMIVEEKYIKDILTDDLKKFINKEEGELCRTDSLIKNKCRMIPYNVISSAGMLPAFKADKFFILNKKNKTLKEAYIAVCPHKTFKTEFQAILNPELIEE